MSDPCGYVGVRGEQCSRLMQLLSPKPRPKRAPSQYNLYAKACIKAKGGIRKFGEAGGLMKQCAKEYKEDKTRGRFRYEIEMPPEVAQTSPTLWKGRDLQKEWKDLYGRVSGKRK